MKLILIGGKARSGKDTVAQMIVDNCEKKTLVIAYADLVKFVATKFLGWNGEKDHHGRTLLQMVGTDLVRKHNPDYWVNFVLTMLNLLPIEAEVIIISDVRFKNELLLPMLTHTDWISIYVERNQDNGLTADQVAHASEVGVEPRHFQVVLKNNGTLDELQEKVFAEILPSI